jgi:cold shock CspA family protein/ribosome-associated translation inhibitor RaiA
MCGFFVLVRPCFFNRAGRDRWDPSGAAAPPLWSPVMSFPLQLSFRNMEPSEAIEKLIREKAVGLGIFASHILQCRVVVERVGKQQGSLFALRFDLTTPGEEIVVQRQWKKDSERRNFHAIIRDAFDVLRRQLEEHTHRRRKEVKTHEVRPQGRVKALFHDEGFGFLTTTDGREIYFHRNSVLGGRFDELVPGTEVAFVEEEGAEGPQASTVRPR